MRHWLFSLLVIAAALPAWAVEVPKAEPRANLTILADDTLMLPLAHLTRDYAVATRTPLTVVIKNAGEAEQQIEQGLEAHVIITADYPMLGRLTDQGLTDVSSRRAIARTGLALVATQDVKKRLKLAERISFAAMLNATGTVPVFINSADTLEGARAAKLLSGYEFSENLATRAAVKPNLDEVVASIHDEDGLGLMLAANSVTEPDLKVLSLLPDTMSAPVTFDAVVLGSESMDEAQSFVSYLSSRKAQAILAHFGYQAPGRQ